MKEEEEEKITKLLKEIQGLSQRFTNNNNIKQAADSLLNWSCQVRMDS